MSGKLIIGVDQSFTETGLCVLSEDGIDFAGAFGLVKDGDTRWKVTTKVEVDEVGVADTKDFQLLMNFGSVDRLGVPGDIDRIFLYARLLRMAFRGILDIEMVDRLYFGIEVPMGSHKGFGVSAEQTFVVAIEIAQEFVPEGMGDTDVIKTYRPNIIKRFMTGKGNAKKDLVREAVRQKTGLPIKSKDIADAVAVAKMVEHIINGGSCGS